MKIGLLLEGGAMRGLYTVGALDVLMKNNIKVDGIVGVSAGALFGLNYKSKQPGRALRYNLKYCQEKKYMGWYSFFTTGNIMNKEFCFDKLINELDPVDYDTFNNSEEDFWAVVTNMESGKPEYIKIDNLRDINQMEALRASGSMPFVSKPVDINGKKYLDGGTADSIPIDKIMEMGFDKIIVILTRPQGYRKEEGNQQLAKIKYRKYPNLINTIRERYKVYNNQVDKVEALEKKGKVFVIRPSRKVDIKRIEKNKERIQEMYDLGVSDTEEKMEQLNNYLNS
ncbi:MAG: patatin family protein [Clostridia bacterium]|nr:patatin family protein [Clostridia bacterium]